ncbi:outer dense fiber protein 2 isoform X3 [Lissotriton helveticus]
MKNCSPTPPLHVHVDESTPVHVYVKKSQKVSPPRVQIRPSISKMKGEVGNLRRTVNVKTKAPWIPPGKTSQPPKDFKWEEPQPIPKIQFKPSAAPSALPTPSRLPSKSKVPQAADRSLSSTSAGSTVPEQQPAVRDGKQESPDPVVLAPLSSLPRKISESSLSTAADRQSSAMWADSTGAEQQSAMNGHILASTAPEDLAPRTSLSSWSCESWLSSAADRTCSDICAGSTLAVDLSVMGDRNLASDTQDELAPLTSLSNKMCKPSWSLSADSSCSDVCADTNWAVQQPTMEDRNLVSDTSDDVASNTSLSSQTCASRLASSSESSCSDVCTDSSWEGATHRLEITPPEIDKMSSSHSCDLSTEEEDLLRSRMQAYDQKLECLMTEIGSLKTEVESQRKSQCHRSSRNKSHDRCKEEDACPTETENARLRRCIDRIKEEKSCQMSAKQQCPTDKDALLCKLVEAEMDGNAAAKQVLLLKESMCKLKNEKHPSCGSNTVNQVEQQKEKLLEKLETFEETNRCLRQLLREQQSREEETQRLVEQKEALLKKLSCCDSEKTRLQLQLCEREKEMEDLLNQLASEKDLAQTATEFTKSIECSKTHLQAQLKKCEGENNCLRAKIQSLDGNEAMHKEELCKVLKEMQDLKARADRDKEDLKKATRAQRQRAERCEESLAQLACQLKGKETQLEEALACVETWRAKVSKLQCEKKQLEDEVTCLSIRVQELIEERQCIEEKARQEKECLLEKMHRLTQENQCIKLEYDRLKATTCAVEEKLNQAQAEVQQLKATVRQYESLVESYKCQVQKTRMEADEICQKLEECDKENKQAKEGMNREVEALRRKFKNRIDELEQLPEMLKSTECKLQECQEQLMCYEKKNNELSCMISDLRMRMEQQGDKMESTRERFQFAVEENKQLNLKLEELERKLDEAGAQNRDLVQIVAKREESIHQNQVRLEEKTRECASLARQLESAIQDAKRQVDQTRERASSKERTTTSKVLDLETQLSRTKTELIQLRRSKEDADRRFQSRLQDMKDRLEQSESTNRSMQNYVQFLKSSYANVFGDTALSSSPVRPRTPL